MSEHRLLSLPLISALYPFDFKSWIKNPCACLTGCLHQRRSGHTSWNLTSELFKLVDLIIIFVLCNTHPDAYMTNQTYKSAHTLSINPFNWLGGCSLLQTICDILLIHFQDTCPNSKPKIYYYNDSVGRSHMFLASLNGLFSTVHSINYFKYYFATPFPRGLYKTQLTFNTLFRPPT